MGAPSRFRRRASLAAEIRTMAWTGLLLGLLAFQALRWWSAPPVVEAPAGMSSAAADRWAETRRSAEILRSRVGAPAPVAPTRRAGSGRASIDPATVRVIDGDTFDVAGTRIRIADIDTPEVFSPRCRREADLGARATRRLRALLDEGPFELLPIGRDEDRYGRKLRVAVRGGRSIGDRLVAEGLARTYDGGARAGWCA